ncbi:MAG: DegT/DnrJ/EryC1/StrS family aminotransferase [Chloroflexi bacterium]|nr:DegT/DnrJ/EryC1/StrS family aminotransferase [Chloroflexota bacterium]
MSKFRVPMSQPDISEGEREAMLGVLDTPRLSMGKFTDAFEADARAYTGAKHAVAVASGTAGLHLCVRAVGIAAGDLVLTTPFSFVASSNVMLYEKAVPVFVDAEAVSGNIDVVQLAEAAADLKAGGERAARWLPRKGAEGAGPLKAILAVDVFGQPADYEAIQRIADEHGLAVIEDSCEAIGAEYKGRKAGLLGDMGVFAFYPNKQMTTGEGGMIVTDDGAAAETMRALRNQGRAPGDTWLQHEFLGYNYRLPEMSAALGQLQMRRLDELLEKRAQVAAWYAEQLGGQPMIERPVILPETTRMSWFLYVVRLGVGLDRDGVIRELESRGIPSRPYFAPIHLQPYMREQFGYQAGDFVVAEELGGRGLALPFSSVMSEDQVALVCRDVLEVVKAGS